MPNLERILGDSAHGVLKSVIPPLTPTAWATLATGVNPGRHGCFNFCLMRSFGDLRPVNSSDIKVETIYETLVKNGYRCTVINLPVSYPARISGTMITGLMTSGDDFLSPPELAEQVPSLKNYQIVPDELCETYHDFKRESDIIIENESVRFEVARDLFGRDWDFFFVLFPGSDWLQHRVFGEMLSGEGEKAEGARRYFRKLDEWVGWLFDNCGPNTLKLIVSNHGFQLMKGHFALNSWLEQNDFLTYVKGKTLDRGPRRKKKIVVGPKVQAVRDRLAKNRLASLLMTFLGRNVMRSERLVKLASSEYRPDFENSRALCFRSGIFVNEEKGGAEQTTDELAAALERFNRGRKVFGSIGRREDIYWGPYVPLAPAMVLIDPLYFYTGPRREKLFLETPIPDHAKDGILVVSGIDALAGKEIAGSLMDIAPTIADWFGVRGPHEYDGKSLIASLDT